MIVSYLDCGVFVKWQYMKGIHCLEPRKLNCVRVMCDSGNSASIHVSCANINHRLIVQYIVGYLKGERDCYLFIRSSNITTPANSVAITRGQLRCKVYQRDTERQGSS